MMWKADGNPVEEGSLSAGSGALSVSPDLDKQQEQDLFLEEQLRQVHFLSIERHMLQTRLNTVSASSDWLLTVAQDDIAALRENIATRFSEIAALTERLVQANQQVERLQALNDDLVRRLVDLEARWPNRVWDRVAKLVRKLRKTLWTGAKRTLGRVYVATRRRRDAQALEMIRSSKLFKESWYRRRYPDVNRTKLSPSEDYFYFGAAEGRSPGPDFDSNAYYNAYPFVARSGLNALVHYESVGKAKGREIWPVKKNRK
jgi:hypothetical protein